MDLDYVATNTNSDSKNHLNPDRSLVRYEFLELLVRLSGDKYVKTGEAKNYTDAFNRILSEGLAQTIKQTEDPNKWRQSRYWNY